MFVIQRDKIMLISIACLIFLSLSDCHLLPVPASTEFESQLSKYFTRYKLHLVKEYEYCSYINSNLPSIKYISDLLIRINACPAVIANRFYNDGRYMPKSVGNFIFIDNLEEVNDTIRHLQSLPFWGSRSQNHFIFDCPFEDNAFLPELFDRIWKNQILEFVVIFRHHDTLDVVSHNPFKGNKINKFVRGSDKLFPEKLNNLHGYELKVSMFENPPLVVKRGNRWFGSDYERLKIVMAMMNATFKIIEPPKDTMYYGAHKDIIDGVTDFCFNSHFQMMVFANAEFSYAHQGNALVILMPKFPAKTHMHSVFKIFDVSTWILLPIVVVVIANMMKYSRNSNLSFFQGLIHTLSTFLGYPFHKLEGRNCSIKLALTVLIFSSVILRTGFQCSLISTFVSPDASSKITTIAQFEQSKIKIYINGVFLDLIPDTYGFKRRIIPNSKSDRLKMMYRLDKSAAQIVPLTFALEVFESLKRRQQENSHYIVDQYLVPGYDTYIFRTNSPYLDKVNECLLQEKQYGWARGRKASRPRIMAKNATQDYDEDVILTIYHLKYVFYLLWFGHVLSILAFIIEIIACRIF